MLTYMKYACQSKQFDSVLRLFTYTENIILVKLYDDDDDVFQGF